MVPGYWPFVSPPLSLSTFLCPDFRAFILNVTLSTLSAPLVCSFLLILLNCFDVSSPTFETCLMARIFDRKF